MGEMQSGGSDAAPGSATLIIEVCGASHIVGPADGVVTIGREPPSQILLSESGVSRTHLRIQYDEDHWSLTDVGSRNGTFLDGVRVEHLAVTGPVTVNLGHANGIALRLDPRPPLAAAPADEAIARAGVAVEDRREELGLSVETLIAALTTRENHARFGSGQLWPDDDVRAVLEQRLMWPSGTIDGVRRGGDVPEEELTDLLSPTVQAAVALDAAEVEVRTIRSRIGQLPDARDERFVREVTPLLTQLRRLDHLGTAAARATPGRVEVAAALAAVRQVRAELVLLAAQSATASLGQRLAAVRHRGRLSIAEVATATGVTVPEVETVEREELAPVGVVDALERFVAVVGGRLHSGD